MFVLVDCLSAGYEIAEGWEENNWNEERTCKAPLLSGFFVGVVKEFTNIKTSKVVSWVLWETETEEFSFGVLG